MKTTFRTIAAVSAAVLALISCSKANIPGGKENTQTAKERVFTLSFNTTSTKTALNADGKTPEFQNGDLIKVFDEINSEELPVTVSGGQATVTVPGSISGDFKAVYPASAWQAEAPYFKVENIQDGTFAKANICLAEVPSGATKMTFTNQTVIFSFDVTSYEGTYIHVIAARDSISNTVVEGNSKINRIIVLESAIDDIQRSDDKTCYVSVYLPQGKTLTCHDISFANGSKIKVPAKTDSPVLAINNIFPVDMTSGWTEPYVEIEMTVNSVKDTYKWATKNIGAESSTDAGLFFMWGETTGLKPNGETFTFPAAKYYSADNSTSTWNALKGFYWENCPYTNGVFEEISNIKVFTKYTGSNNEYAKSGNADDKTVLDLCDDAANANWGGSWRMPTRDEFAGLASLDPEGQGWDDTNKGNRLTDANGNSIFFPAAGYGEGTSLCSVGDYGGYWASSLGTGTPSGACCLGFYDSPVSTSNDSRHSGNSVRALSD